MSRKPKAVPLSKLEDIQASLKQKATTPKTITVEELVKSLAKPIQDMLDAGYSYEDVSDVFKGHGVELAASGIKSFHKKAITTTTTATDNQGSESATDSENDSTATGNSVPAVEADASLPDAVEQSEKSQISTSTTSPKTTSKKGAGKTHSQFNVTDRSSV
ncbi:hypothetical protein [Anabaena azotica]|uniref:hypothetical protein n=1 Tax=Anabaena azotica TaxID=197653 RepID=UPI0039A6EFBC